MMVKGGKGVVDGEERDTQRERDREIWATISFLVCPYNSLG